jgi:glycine/serine hydroxymethyltransferase
MGFPEMEKLADLIHRTLEKSSDAAVRKGLAEEVRELSRAFPIYPGV